MNEKLKSLMANLWILFFAARNAHWNIQGENFKELHQFFADVYDDAENKADIVAERIRQLGDWAPGCMTAVLEYKTSDEVGNTLSSQGEACTSVMNVVEQIISELKELIEQSQQEKDYATNNMLMNMIEQLDKTYWMLRSYTM